MRLVMLLALFSCTNGTTKSPLGSADVETVRDLDSDGYFVDDGDCDDENATIHPGAAETCDGLDNNCNGEIDEQVMLEIFIDNDGDGFGNSSEAALACEVPDGYVENDVDCDDNDDTIHPQASESCDEVDNDCDGLVDEQLTELWFYDGDLDGYGDAEDFMEGCFPNDGYVDNSDDCDDEDETIYPEAEEICDGLDNDCDEQIDEDVTITVFVDFDADGFGNDDILEETCEVGDYQSLYGGDCDDLDSNINPNASEYCDFIDNNCNEIVDESSSVDSETWYEDNDGDGDGNPSVVQTSCYQPNGYVLANTDCDDEDASVYTGAPEICDGLVNTCAGALAANEVDNDGDGYVECLIDGNGWDGSTSVIGGQDCDDDNSAYHQVTTYYPDTDNDGFGDPSAALAICVPPSSYTLNAEDCDDSDGSIYPSATELCDGQVNACGTSLDASEIDDDTDGYVECVIDVNGWDGATSISGGEDCNDTDAGVNPGAIEYCDDIDSNCDGSLVDGFANFDGDNEPDCLDDDDDNDGFSDGDDCSATDATIYPGAEEICDNGIDEDCSGDDLSCVLEPWQESGGYYLLTKPDGSFYSGAACNGNFFGSNETTVNGIPFAVGPYTTSGRMAGLPPNTNIYSYGPNALINNIYIIFPGGRCSSQPLSATFYYSDGSSYTTGQLSIPHDCGYSSSIGASNAQAVYQGNYGGPCCAHWYWGQFSNPSPSQSVDSISIYYSDGCGGSYNGQIWSVTVD